MSTKPKQPALPLKLENRWFKNSVYRRGIADLKNNMGGGRDDVLVEQLNKLGPQTHKCLLAMLDNCFTHNNMEEIKDHRHIENREGLCDS